MSKSVFGQIVDFKVGIDILRYGITARGHGNDPHVFFLEFCRAFFCNVRSQLNFADLEFWDLIVSDLEFLSVETGASRDEVFHLHLKFVFARRHLCFDDFRHKRPLFNCAGHLCAAIRERIGCAIDGCVTFVCQRNGQLYVYETRIGFLLNFDLLGRDAVVDLEIGLAVGSAGSAPGHSRN